MLICLLLEDQDAYDNYYEFSGYKAVLFIICQITLALSFHSTLNTSEKTKSLKMTKFNKAFYYFGLTYLLKTPISIILTTI